MNMNLELVMLTAAALVTGSVVLAAGPADGKEEDQVTTILERSRANPGDIGRIQHVLAKARRGEKIVVGAIGGSITDGGHVGPDQRYGKRVTTWFQKTFPEAKARYVNAGVGATGSDFGALRAQRDLLKHNPDLVIVEFAVNEPNEKASGESMEGLVRQILKHPNHPAVIMLFTMHKTGKNSQEWQGKVGMHYDLPMVSYRDALWPEIEAGRMRWDFVTKDSVHPNVKGHEYMARFVTHVLEKELQDLPSKLALPAIKPMPQPLFTDLYEHVTMLEPDALKPVANEGWTIGKTQKGEKCWKGNKPGSVIEFEVEGQAIATMVWYFRGPMGKAKMQLDDLPPTVVDSWVPYTWGGLRKTEELARDLKPGKHRVRIEILEEKNPKSTGHEVHLLGLGALGVGTARRAASRTKELPFDENRETRTWTSTKGKTLEAKLLRTVGSRVELETSEGEKMKIYLRSISKADREYIQSLKQ